VKGCGESADVMTRASGAGEKNRKIERQQRALLEKRIRRFIRGSRDRGQDFNTLRCAEGRRVTKEREGWGKKDAKKQKY